MYYYYVLIYYYYFLFPIFFLQFTSFTRGSTAETGTDAGGTSAHAGDATDSMHRGGGEGEAGMETE
jgi:hypothetical protein